MAGAHADPRDSHGHGHGHSHAAHGPDHAHDEGHALQTDLEQHEHEHAHGAAARDNNMRSAVVHVLADAGVSVLVIVGLLFGRFLGW